MGKTIEEHNKAVRDNPDSKNYPLGLEQIYTDREHLYIDRGGLKIQVDQGDMK